jgi:hypothetical protein
VNDDFRDLLGVLLAAGAWLVLAGCAEAQTRPLQTEEAATAARGTTVLEIGADAIADEPNYMTGLPRDRWAGPVLRLVYSPADDVEIDVEWTARVGQIDDPTYGTVSDWGDVGLRAKVRFVDEGPGRPALAARFGVLLPETSFGNGLGPNALRMAVQVLASKDLGWLSLHGNGGLALHDEVFRPHEQRDFFAYGIAAVARVRPGLAVVGEWAGLSGQGQPGADAHAEARAGVRWGTGRLRADAAVRRGLLSADGTWGLTAGVTWRLR